MRSRNGKIARLPSFVRDQLNERLECSEPGPQLLAWLNARPEVKELLEKDFAGVPISKQNLSEWRAGGFEEWLARRDLCFQAADLCDLTEDMENFEPEGGFADSAAAVLAVRMGSLLANWNGEVDDKFEARSRVLNRLGRSVVQLQRAMHRSRRDIFEMRRLEEEKEKAAEEETKEKLTARLFDIMRVPTMAKYFGGGAMGDKIAEYILAIQRGEFDAKLDLRDSDTTGAEEAGKKAKKTAKPVCKRQADRKGRKTEPENPANPLDEKSIDAEPDEEISTESSNPVKANQTINLSDEPAAKPEDQPADTDPEEQRQAVKWKKSPPQCQDALTTPRPD